MIPDSHPSILTSNRIVIVQEICIAHSSQTLSIKSTEENAQTVKVSETYHSTANRRGSRLTMICFRTRLELRRAPVVAIADETAGVVVVDRFGPGVVVGLLLGGLALRGR